MVQPHRQEGERVGKGVRIEGRAWAGVCTPAFSMGVCFLWGLGKEGEWEECAAQESAFGLHVLCDWVVSLLVSEGCTALCWMFAAASRAEA